LGDLLERLGGIPPQRIRMHPPPGTATVADVAAIDKHEEPLCELVDGVLVEKGMGIHESLLAMVLGTRLRLFVDPRNLGLVTGPDCMLQLFPGLVRIPDVAFASWSRLPGGNVPDDPVPPIAPDLAVEVLSRSNTPAEMNRKLREYFEAGVRLVWLVDPRRRTVSVYTSFDALTVLSERQTLTGGDVLPGFKLPLKKLFAELDRRAGDRPSRPRKSNRKKS
jgi:Uma2 family endonuclease